MNEFCFNETIVGAVTTQSRHRDKEKCFEAIYRQIVSLDSAGHMPNVIVEYKYLFKVPRRLPGEHVNDPALDRIEFLERSVARIVAQNENIISELVDLKKNPPVNVPLFTDIVAQESAVTLARNHTSAQTVTQMRNHSAMPVTQGRSHISAQPSMQVRSQSVMPVTQARNHISAQSNVAQVSVANGNEGWQEQNRRRRPRPKAIQGTYKSQGDNEARRVWAAAPRDMFVYHTDIQTSEDDINAIIEETSKVQVLRIEKKSHADAYYGSFRVSVRRNDYEKAMLPENWPDGWSIREYFQPRAKRVLVPEASEGGQPINT